MDRDQLIEHLTFAKELGVSGVNRDPAWRLRQETVPSKTTPDPSSERTPDPFSGGENTEKSPPIPLISVSREGSATAAKMTPDPVTRPRQK